MSIEENKAIVKRLWEEYLQERNDAVLEELFSPDYVETVTGGPGWEVRPTRGPEVYRSAMRGWWGAFPDLTATVEQMIGEGDKVLTVWRFSGTHQGDWRRGPSGVTIKPTGRRLNMPGMILSRISGGKIVEEWGSLDLGLLWEQLGAIPTPDS